jgi:hypothetical protein
MTTRTVLLWCGVVLHCGVGIERPRYNPNVCQPESFDELGEVADRSIAQVVIHLDNVSVSTLPIADLMDELFVLRRDDQVFALVEDVEGRDCCLLLLIEVHISHRDPVLIS